MKKQNLRFGQDIGIDLGTASVLAYIEDRGIVLREPSIIAIDKQTSEVIEVGNKAKKMLGKAPKNIEVIKPLCDGAITNYTNTQKMLKIYINKIVDKTIISPRLMISVPSGATEVEQKAVINAGFSSGARQVFLIKEPIAASLGAGLNMNTPIGTMIIDIGGGTTEIAVISMGEIVVSNSVKVAGNYFDNAIASYVSKNYGIEIGERTAEEVKMKIGCVYPLINDIEYDIYGYDQINEQIKHINIKSSNIYEALKEAMQLIIDSIVAVLEQTPPQLVSDIAKCGICLTGGGCLINGLDKLIFEKTNIPAYRADDPITCVAKGTGKALENLDEYKLRSNN